MASNKIDDQGRALPSGMLWVPKKNGGGSYYLTFRVNGGVRKKRIGRTFTEAKAARDKIMYEVREGKYLTKKDLTVADMAQKFIEQKRDADRVKPTTLGGIESRCRLEIVPRLGRLKLRQVTREHCDRFKAELLKDGRLSDESVNKYLVTLRALFGLAREWGYISTNPAEFIKRLETKPSEIKLLTNEQYNRLLAIARGQTRLMVLAGIMSGCRAGELTGLTWGRVDLLNGVIEVRQTYTHGLMQDTAKTKSSIRDVEICAELVDALARHKPDNAADGDFVFTNAGGGPVDWNNFLHREWYPLLQEADAPHIRFHDLRHVFVSILVSAGEEWPYIQAQVGHSNLSETMNTYTHLRPGRATGARQRMSAAFAGILNGEPVRLTPEATIGNERK